MSILSEEGRRVLGEIAQRHGVSLGAVEHLLMAIIAGQGTQAQFGHPELGGMGQWSQGGMIMVGDMFNNALKAKVDGLCTELSQLVRSTGLLTPSAPRQSQSQYQGGGAQYQSGGGVSLFVPGALSAGNWWPEELGHPASVGAQNALRYAFFPATRRLAINIGGRVAVYDTKDHRIGGFSQQQSGDQSLTFTSQHGLVRVADLEVVPPAESGSGGAPSATTKRADKAKEETDGPSPPQAAEPERVARPAPDKPVSATPKRPAAESEDDVFAKIERLAALHAKGILTDQEFEAKKADLLDRL